jgi:phosphatidylglycerophosphatase A
MKCSASELLFIHNLEFIIQHFWSPPFVGHASNEKYAARVAALPMPKNRWPAWIVTGGGLGFLKPAPGSWGTCGPAVIYLLLLFGGVGDPLRSVLCLIGAAITGALLIYFGVWACAYFRQPDPGQVVLDEYAGFWVAVAFVPIPAICKTRFDLFLFTAAIYIVFRLTDTLKIPPGRQLEKLPWGWGILLDDLAAGVQANLIAQVVVRLFLHG